MSRPEAWPDEFAGERAHGQEDGSHQQRQRRRLPHLAAADARYSSEPHIMLSEPPKTGTRGHALCDVDDGRGADHEAGGFLAAMRLLEGLDSPSCDWQGSCVRCG